MNVESHELAPFAPVPDTLVLAAVERAQRHRSRSVARWHIATHLGFKHNGWTTRRLRPQLESLSAGGSLCCERRGWRESWTLTVWGRRRLGAARRNATLVLPESPQHRTWRHAREEADRRLEEIYEAVTEALGEADALDFQREAAADSDRLFHLGERLQWEFKRLAVATHCLWEWVEPDDAHCDTDDRSRIWRRDYRSLQMSFNVTGADHDAEDR